MVAVAGVVTTATPAMVTDDSSQWVGVRVRGLSGQQPPVNQSEMIIVLCQPIRDQSTAWSSLTCSGRDQWGGRWLWCWSCRCCSDSRVWTSSDEQWECLVTWQPIRDEQCSVLTNQKAVFTWSTVSTWDHSSASCTSHTCTYCHPSVHQLRRNTRDNPSVIHQVHRTSLR